MTDSYSSSNETGSYSNAARALVNQGIISETFLNENIFYIEPIVQTAAFASIVDEDLYIASQIFDYGNDLNAVQDIFTNTAFEKFAADDPFAASRAFDYSHDVNTVKDIVLSSAFASIVDDSPHIVSQVFDYDNDINAVKDIFTNTAFEKFAADDPFAASRVFDYSHDVNTVKDIVLSSAFASIVDDSPHIVSQVFDYDNDINAVKDIFTNTAFEKFAADDPHLASRAFDYSHDVNTVKDIVLSSAFASIVDDSPHIVSQVFDYDNDINAVKDIFTNTAFEKFAADDPFAASRAFDYSHDVNTVKDIVLSSAFAAIVDDSPHIVSQIFDYDNDINTVKDIFTNTAFEKFAADDPHLASRAFDYSHDVNTVKDIVLSSAFASIVNDNPHIVSQIFDYDNDINTVKDIFTNTAFEKFAADDPFAARSLFANSNTIVTLNNIFKSTEFADFTEDPSFSITPLLELSGDLEENWKTMILSHNVIEFTDVEITLDQRHSDISGGDFLELSYTLKGNDLTGNPGGDASTLGVDSSGLTNVAVLGPNTSSANSYTLEISAESLQAGWNLESADIALKYNADIFGEITANDITIDGDLPIKNSISIDDENGLIRFAASSLGDLGEGSSILGETILASINLDFDDSYFQNTARTPDSNGKFTFEGNPLGFELSANSDETIFSRTFQSDADGHEIGGSQSFDINESEFAGSNIEVISSTKYWAGQKDILHFNTDLDNSTGVKSVVVSEQINNEWVDIVSKSAEEIYGVSDTLPGSISWAYNSLEENIGRSTIFGENQLRIQSFYEDAAGNTHVSNSYYDKPAEGFINNSHDVNSSESFVLDIDTFTNREIKSLGDLDGGTVFDMGDVNLYQAEIKFSEQVDGLTFGTQRIIGSNQSFTNLIRKGDTVTAETSIENVGNSLAKNVIVTDAKLVDNAGFTSSRFLDSNGNELINNTTSSINLSGGVFDDNFNYDSSSQESVNLEIGMYVTGAAGSVIDVSKGLFQVSAAGMIQNPDTASTPEIFISGSGSKNLITYQGDLNYDGRVSMKDLAYLNAGAARQELIDGIDGNGNSQVASEASYARDVDADFSGKIDLADLSVLDKDWGKSLHIGDQDFQGSAEVSWNDLDGQGDNSKWDNSSFKEQNSIEAEENYVASLEAPATSGVIGSEGNPDGSNSLEGESFQDPLDV